MLLVLSLGSHALTLGRARGGAIVGQPVNIVVPVSAAGDEDVTDLCFEADVFYGENKVEGRRVTVSSEPPVAGQTWQVRITSRLAVDEPVVTLHLRSACTAKTSRRYVFLADIASEAAPVSASVAPLPVLIEPSSGSASRSEHVTSDLLPAEAGSVGGPSVKSAAVGSKVKGREKASSQTAAPKVLSTGKSRLRLAPLDLSLGRDIPLKVTAELMSSPTDDAQKRGEAAALWRVLNLSPEDVMRDTARLNSLESSVQRLNEASGQNQRLVKELMGRLERAEEERYQNPLVVGLGGLVLLLAAGGVWLYWRQKKNGQGSPWWTPAGDQDVGLDSDFGESPESAKVLSRHSALIQDPKLVVDPAAGHGQEPAGALVDIELDFGFLGEGSVEPTPKEIKGQVAGKLHSQGNVRDFSHSLAASLREINTQEVLDIRQQAEFFMTLGQHEEAIALLAGHAAEAGDINPLVYLDLLAIFHTLSRKEDFDSYRDEFNAVFTGYVPQYSDFSRKGEGLDACPEICEQLVKLWPSHGALDFLQATMLRQADAPNRMIFELEVFKDMLMLHAVGSRLVNALDGAPAAFSATKSVVREAASYLTGPGPIDASLPVNTLLMQEVDVVLDIPDIANVSETAPVANLIDFDVSGVVPAESKSAS